MAGQDSGQDEQRTQGPEARGSAAERRRLVAGYFVAALLAAAIVAAIVVVISAGGGDDSSTAAGDPFGPHHGGLESRRLNAGVPTMAEGGSVHFHPELALYAGGKRIPVPPNIGIDPAQPPTAMAGLHTHDEGGTIHVEAGNGATLGQFFEVWGVPFSHQQLGPNKASGSKVVRMWVDGQPSEEFGDLQLEDGQQIVIAYGPTDDPPPSEVGS